MGLASAKAQHQRPIKLSRVGPTGKLARLSAILDVGCCSDASNGSAIMRGGGARVGGLERFLPEK